MTAKKQHHWTQRPGFHRRDFHLLNPATDEVLWCVWRVGARLPRGWFSTKADALRQLHQGLNHGEDVCLLECRMAGTYRITIQAQAAPIFAGT
jgi:hypothetical protein